MKTLLQKQKDYQEETKLDTNYKSVNALPKKKDSRITSAYIATKIVKGLPIMMPSQSKTVQQAPQFIQSQPQGQFFNPRVEDAINERQQSKETQFDPPMEVRVQSASENALKRNKEVRDLKAMIQKVQFNPPYPNYEEVIIQNKFPEYLYDVREAGQNYNVHKHLTRLKSSKLTNYSQIPRNQSSKLERQRDVIEKTLAVRQVQSQQIKRRVPTSVQRPKTSNLGTASMPINSAKSHLSEQWMQLTKQAYQARLDQDKQEIQEVKEKSLSHLELENNFLSQKEKEYIKKRKNFFLDDMRPYISVLQQKAEQKKAMAKKDVIIDKFDQYNSLLSGMDDDEKFIEKEDSYEMLEDDIKIKDISLQKNEGLFAAADELNESINHNLKEIKLKFHQLDQMEERQRAQQEKQEKDKPANYLKVSDKLTFDELTIIIKEIQKPYDQRNYDLLESMISRLKFFEKFKPNSRILLLQLSEIVKYEYGEYIFKQGDRGDKMYIILTGACHVRIKNPHNPEDDLGPVVSTLYDGQNFGELALIDSKTKISKNESSDLASGVKYNLKMIRNEMQHKEQEKEKAKNWWKKDQQEEQRDQYQNIQPMRSASIQAAETTYLLAVSREKFQSIILNVITQELEDKIKTISIMPCFDLLSNMQLIPIANLLEQQTYRLGQVILKEQEPQKYFYIVAKGRCKFVKEEIFIRDLKSLGYPDKTNKPLKTGLIDCTIQTLLDSATREDTKLRVKHHSLNLKVLEPSPIQQSYQYQEIFENKEYKAFRFHFHYGVLVRGDFFMGRALLSEYKAFDEEIQELKYDVCEPSRLTVISDAAETVVYKLNKSNLHIIPNPLKQFLIDGIKRKHEFDHIFDYDESKKVKQWDTYKMNLFKEVMDNKQLKKRI